MEVPLHIGIHLPFKWVNSTLEAVVPVKLDFTDVNAWLLSNNGFLTDTDRESWSSFFERTDAEAKLYCSVIVFLCKSFRNALPFEDCLPRSLYAKLTQKPLQKINVLRKLVISLLMKNI